MGKVRRERKKYHSSAAKTDKIEKMCVEAPAETKVSSNIKLADNVFSGIKILPDVLLKQRLPEFEKQEEVAPKPATKPLRRPRPPKKKRAKLGHELLLQKLEVTRQNLTNARKSKQQKKKKLVVVGDMQTLIAALPEVDTQSSKGVSHKKSKEQKVGRPKAIKKSKTREKERLENLKMFRRVLKHPACKADPAGTISLHIQNKIQMEHSEKS